MLGPPGTKPPVKDAVSHVKCLSTRTGRTAAHICQAQSSDPGPSQVSRPDVRRLAHRSKMEMVAFVIAVIQRVQVHRGPFGGRDRHHWSRVTHHVPRDINPVAPSTSSRATRERDNVMARFSRRSPLWLGSPADTHLHFTVSSGGWRCHEARELGTLDQIWPMPPIATFPMPRLNLDLVGISILIPEAPKDPL